MLSLRSGVGVSPYPPALRHLADANFTLATPNQKIESLKRCGYRFEGAPDIPTVGDVVPGYEASQWYGVGVPKNTPVDIVEKLNKEINAGLANPKLRAQLADLGGTMLPGSAADFGKLIAEETEKWAKAVKFSGAQPD